MTSLFTSLYSYCSACMHVRCIDSWLALNKQYFGNETLYAGDIVCGAFFGYTAAVCFKKTIKLGVFVAGVGFIAAQVHHNKQTK